MTLGNWAAFDIVDHFLLEITHFPYLLCHKTVLIFLLLFWCSLSDILPFLTVILYTFSARWSYSGNGFSHNWNADDFQIFMSSSELSTEFWTSVFTWLLDISTWMSFRHFKHQIPQMPHDLLLQNWPSSRSFCVREWYDHLPDAKSYIEHHP